MIDTSTLSKTHQRKLDALRKSLGQDIADRAFAEWYKSQAPVGAPLGDRTAERIAEVLMELIAAEKIQIRRGGYRVLRGRGRVIVEPIPVDGTMSDENEESQSSDRAAA